MSDAHDASTTLGTVRTAAALLIGNEILSGKIQEGNLQGLAQELRGLGISLRRVVVIGDDIDEIAAEVTALRTTHDVVFTSGGVGPTHDDLTLAGIARSFGVGLARHPEMEQLLRDFYASRCTEAHLRMADLPEGTRLVRSAEIAWPTIVRDNVWIFPGVPQIFRLKLPSIRTLRGGPPIHSRAIFTKLEEPEIADALDAVARDFPHVAIGSYPQWTDPAYRVKLTFDGTDEQELDRAISAFQRGQERRS
ncbi:MAG: competence/damage-inducible protein A [Deltaproteobacteria bacterium]|nr:competence/damage-inducible protein A [Deltaproteobacteria bacterium]